jgi:5,6,7,8-tetrahydromethanopterin hydro-lyase
VKKRVTRRPAGDLLDGRIGEAWSGVAPNGSHINVVLGRRGSPTAAAIAGALASPRPGHVPFLACIEPGTVVRPITVVVNKSSLGEPTLDRITWGAAQLGIAQGVLDAVADGTLPAEEVDSLVLLVAVWVDPKAHQEATVKTANRAAMRAALADAVTIRTVKEIKALAARREKASSPYYGGG